MKKGIDILIEARRKIADNGLELLKREIIRLEYENDTLRAFIIDIYDTNGKDIDKIFEARDYIKQLNKPK